eukprot:8879012-Alexandrium_andersonii.AAC.1
MGSSAPASAVGLRHPAQDSFDMRATGYQHPAAASACRTPSPRAPAGYEELFPGIHARFSFSPRFASHEQFGHRVG